MSWLGTFIADFETTTNKNDCRVWAYALCEVGNEENLIIGNNINDFMSWCSNKRENHVILFHNLKFDAQFIMVWLFNNNFIHTTEMSDRKTRTFNTTINEKGMYYQLEVIFDRNGKTINKVTFQDSLKLIPLSVEEIPETFGLPYEKLSIDYKANREVGHELTEEEKAYITNDVKIVAKAIEFFYSQGLNKMTIGSCALAEYKSMIKEKNFMRYFPSPKYDADVRQSYYGGWTYLNPKFEGKTVGKGVVLDINSIYSSVMYEELLPYGTPIYYEGEYKQDDFYPLYIQMIRCQFELKKGKLPTVQLRRLGRSNEYLTSSNDTQMTLCLTKPDLELFFEHYDVYNPEYMSGWKFKGTTGLFKDYIEKWYGEKVKAEKEGNKGMRFISKMYLNHLYGKFSSKLEQKTKVPYMNKKGVVTFKDGIPKKKEGIYIPIATFITSFARKRILTAAQKIQDDYNAGKSKIQFIYADTDSLHLLSPDYELPECLNINQTEMGAFKHEGNFRRAKFLRQKCYIEELSKPHKEEYNLKVTVAGMPEECYQYVNFTNFKIGAKYKGKLEPQRVPGGVILGDVDFTIKKV